MVVMVAMVNPQLLAQLVLSGGLLVFQNFRGQPESAIWTIFRLGSSWRGKMGCALLQPSNLTPQNRQTLKSENPKPKSPKALDPKPHEP